MSFETDGDHRFEQIKKIYYTIMFLSLILLNLQLYITKELFIVEKCMGHWTLGIQLLFRVDSFRVRNLV